MKFPRLITSDKLEHLIQTRINEALARHDAEQQLELLKKQADIAMLQAQINPHFLYNTLECIRSQALIKSEPEIAAIAQALSIFYRYSISTKEDIVTLREELINVENYVYIQKYRFRDRFNLLLDIDKSDLDLMNIALPKLTLQPLIENAIIHGLSSHVKPDAYVRITAELTAKHANIHISDNGIGIAPEILNRLNNELYDMRIPIKREGHGIALMNVHRRLAFLFGNDYGLNISSYLNIGTDIEIHIPQMSTTELLIGAVEK